MEKYLSEKVQIFSNVDLDNIDSAELRALVDSTLELIGMPNPELRDSVLYPFLEKIISAGKLSNEDCADILQICISKNNLHYRLGEISDTVFRRAFSSLIIAAILDANIRRKFLPVEIIDQTFTSALSYLEKERDTRGYVAGKGWAHAMAHGAEMLQSLVQSPQIDVENFPDILSTIETCLFKDTATYIDQEEERFVGVVKAMMDRGLQGSVLERWIILMLSRMANLYASEGFSYRYYRANVNVNNFLKSLYFRLKFDGERLKLRVFIYESVKKLQKLYPIGS